MILEPKQWRSLKALVSPFGKPIARDTVFAVLIVLAVVQDPAKLKACRFVEKVCPAMFRDPNKLKKFITVYKNIVAAHDLDQLLVFAFEHLAVALLNGDVSEDEANIEFLVGARPTDKAWAHETSSRFDFLRWFFLKKLRSCRRRFDRGLFARLSLDQAAVLISSIFLQ